MLSARRERIVQGLGILAGAMLLLSFFLPRGSSHHWQFGWNGSALPMVIEILQIFVGIALIATLVLPLPRFLKGVAMLAMGVLLSGLIVFDSIDSFSGFFKHPFWIDHIIWVIFPAIAAALAFNADSLRSRSARHALAIVGGAAMLLLAVMPVNYARGAGLRPVTAFLEVWDMFPGRTGFAEFLFMCTLTVVVSMGPIAGALLMFHGGLAVVAPGKQIRGAGPAAGAVFLLWYPASFFVFFLWMWAKLPIVFTSYVVHIAPTLGCGFLLAAGLHYFGEALADAPERADSIHPGLGALIRGFAMAPAVPGVVGSASPAPDGAWGPPSREVAPPQAPPAQAWGATDAAPPNPAWDARPDARPQGRGHSDGAAQQERASATGQSADAAWDDGGWSTKAPLAEAPRAPQAPPQEDWEKPTQALDISQFADLQEPESAPPAAAPDDHWPTQGMDVSQIEAFSANDASAAQSMSPEAHWEQGATAWAEQRWDDALRHYSAVFSAQPTRTEAARALADIHYGLGNLDDAERFYRQVLLAWPEDEYAQQALEQIALYRQ